MPRMLASILWASERLVYHVQWDSLLGWSIPALNEGRWPLLAENVETAQSFGQQDSTHHDEQDGHDRRIILQEPGLPPVQHLRRRIAREHVIDHHRCHC